jgi:hypothetical protein
VEQIAARAALFVMARIAEPQKWKIRESESEVIHALTFSMVHYESKDS